MKELDAFTINTIGIPSLVLMERAGLKVYEAMCREQYPLKRVLVLCGSGNNGADGVVIARLLHLSGHEVDVCILGNPEHFTEEMRKQTDIGKKYGISFVKTFVCDEYTTIVDAIFGVGLSRPVTGRYSEVIDLLHEYQGKVVSVDIPSGICADTGAILGNAVKADMTVTFAYKKAGLCFYPGASYAGKLLTADIGIYMENEWERTPRICACTSEELQYLKRKPAGNKGTFGKVLLIAGSRDIFGAAYLAGRSAMKTGAGMLKICTREENRQMFQCFPEAMLLTYSEKTGIPSMLREAMEWADVIGIGPGLGTFGQAQELLACVLADGRKPLVIDADGLNLLKERKELLRRYPGEVILTPHLGEFSRLTDIGISQWKKNPIGITQKAAGDLKAVLVCKDARTVISRGNTECYINLSGNDGMATAGSGDVLTGIILGLLAQGLDAQRAACTGTYLHGIAGERASRTKGRAGMLAGDIIEAAAEVLQELE